MNSSSLQYLFGVVLLWCTLVGNGAQVIINEFQASNSLTLADQDGDYSDWIELYNSGDEAVDLQGWYLTDNASELTKWQFPKLSLAPKAYLLVFASGKDRNIAGAELHTNFSLDADGESLALIKPDGTTVVSEFAPAFPEQFKDVSYGVYQGTYVYFTKPSPGAATSFA